MNKENEFNLNLSYNSEDKVSILSISNKSKSSSSNNQKSIKRPKKLNRKKISNQNSSSFSIYQKKIKRINSNEQNSFSFYTFTKNSINKYDTPKNKKEKTEENKSISKKKEAKINLENETPKKKKEKINISLDKFEYKKKDLLTIDNINGKNLMEYFEKMSENISTEEKKEDRISSVGNKLKNSFIIKNTFINTNKSWNKNNYLFMSAQKPLKLINKKKQNKESNNSKILSKRKNQSINSHNISSNVKNLQMLLNKNNINIDLKNLIDQYRPNKILKKRINNNTISADKTIDDKKTISFSHLKSRETAKKNLFNDYNKINDEMTNINKYINKNERKQNEKLYDKNNIFNPQFFQLNKNNNLIMNSKKKESNENKNKQKINNFFLKYKEKIETDKNKKSGI